MFPIGIDWSEKHLDYCIENNSGDVIRGRRRDRPQSGLRSIRTATQSC